MRRVPGRSGGFTYIGLLVAIVLIGGALAAVAETWSLQARREREAELLYRGHAIRRAIGAYVALNAGGSARYPMELENLVQDDRWPQVRRYLRRVYEDPMTGQADWTLIRAPDGGIMGVASSSQAEPIKRAGFKPDDNAFSDADCYCDWKFIYQPRRNFLAPSMPTAPGNPGNGPQGQSPQPSPAPAGNPPLFNP